MIDVTPNRTLAGTLGAADAEAYDAFVDRARGGVYAQARAWEPAALAGRRFAPSYFLARRSGRVVGAAMVLRPIALGPLRVPSAIVERGPVVDDLGDLGDVLAALRRALLARGVVRIEVNPYWADAAADDAERILEAAGYRSVQTLDGAHARTLRVDLAGKDEASLFAGKSGESTRRKARLAEKAGAVAKNAGRAGAAPLARLHAELMGRQDKGTKPQAYWDALGELAEKGERGAIFTCEHEGEVVSALYASRHGRLATFVVGASSPTELPFNKMTLPMSAAIRWAHAQGCLGFDMGGIPMEGDTDEKRNSIAQFKLDFAKAPVRLVRAHARWL